mmetsp:Transcript_27549/g.47848  ORF Transcript_27549/g.47848 Transcript_27549/m.47848 type:complete len:97 (+) Transcript_27549:183-473(+)
MVDRPGVVHCLSHGKSFAAEPVFLPLVNVASECLASYGAHLPLAWSSIPRCICVLARFYFVGGINLYICCLHFFSVMDSCALGNCYSTACLVIGVA